MKKIALITLVSLFAIFVATSCTKDCKKCKAVTKDASGNIIDNGTDTEYCDAALDEKESAEPSTVGGNTTTWVCQ